MKKQLLSLALLMAFFFTQQTNAQSSWTRTNVVTADYLPITDLEYHKGDLYATINELFSGKLQKSTDNGQSWTQIGSEVLQGIPTFMTTVGDYLYVATNDALNGAFIYRSNDGGSSWETDTVGITERSAGGGLSILVIELQNLNGNIAIRHGSYYYYRDPSSNDPYQTFTTPTALVGSTDPVGYYNGSLYGYDNGGSLDFHVSKDFGQTWTIPSATGLPGGLSSELMTVNEETGRIYLSGRYNSGGVDYGIYYSDDEGENWTEMDFSAFGTNNHLGDHYIASAIYSQGGTTYFAFENDANNTTPDVVGSTDYPNTGFAFDTLGLEAVPGTVNGVRFAVSNGKIAMALNLTDVYVKDLSGSTSTNSPQLEKVHCYPNPTSDRLFLQGINNIAYQVFNIQGIMVQAGQVDNYEIDLSGLSKGIYQLQLATSQSIRIVKL